MTLFIILWITSGFVGAYLLFRDWTRDLDMSWGVFSILCILVPTGPCCLLLGIIVFLGGLKTPKFFKSRSTKEGE